MGDMKDSSPQFTRRRFVRGYAVEDVDTFLDAVSAALANGTEVPDIAAVRFSPKLGGYSETEVDDFLDELRRGIAAPSAHGAATLIVADLPEPPAFTTVRGFRRGYNVANVDGLLGGVWSAVRDGREPSKVMEARFTTTFGGGYDEAEVDDYLDVLSAALKQ